MLQGDIIATCERHIYGLEVIIDANDDTKVLPDVEVLEVKGKLVKNLVSLYFYKLRKHILNVRIKIDIFTIVIKDEMI